MTSITIPDNIHSIDDIAFSNCTGLASITIPNSVEGIGNQAFSGCTSLSSIIIPNSVSYIGNGAFLFCDALTSITIPESVTSIGSGTFAHCKNLVSVTLPQSITSIGGDNRYGGAFGGCTSLTTIIIPSRVTSIGNQAFLGCENLKTVKIGSGLKSIGSYAFMNCPELADLYCSAVNVPSTNTDVFKNSYIEHATLHVPTESVDAYKAANNWKNIKSIVSIEDGDIPELQKCATPTISYNNGQLTFACSTDGVEYVSEITNSDIKKNFEATVTLTATYNISVYATKVGFERSEVATATLCWIDQQPQTEDGLVEVKAKALLIKNNDGCITVEGADDGERVSVYTLSGVQVGGAVCNSGMAVVNTNLQKGEIVVIKVGERSVKVLLK